MGVCPESVGQWEAGVGPADRLWPRVVGFLGYDPTQPPRTPGERLRTVRRRLGLSVKAFAKALPCDEETAAKWESDRLLPGKIHSQALDALLGPDWRSPSERP